MTFTLKEQAVLRRDLQDMVRLLQQFQKTVGAVQQKSRRLLSNIQKRSDRARLQAARKKSILNFFMMRQERKMEAGSVHERSESHGETEELEAMAEKIGGELADADQDVVDVEQTLDAVVSHSDAEDMDRAETHELREAARAAEKELATSLGTVLDRIRRQAGQKAYKLLISGLLLTARTGEVHASPRDPKHDDAPPAVEQQHRRRVSGLREMLSKHGVVIEEKKIGRSGRKEARKKKMSRRSCFMTYRNLQRSADQQSIVRLCLSPMRKGRSGLWKLNGTAWEIAWA